MSSPKELAIELRDAKARLDEAKAVVTQAQKEFDRLRFSVIPDALNDLGVSSLNLPDVGRLGLTEDMRVSVLAENREECYHWMAENGFGDIVVDTIHSSTLKAWAKEQFAKNGELPAFIQMEPFQRASLTKR